MKMKKNRPKDYSTADKVMDTGAPKIDEIVCRVWFL